MTADIADGNLVFLMNGPTKATVISAYRDALREIAPTIPVVLFATLRKQMDAALGSQRAITFLSTSSVAFDLTTVVATSALLTLVVLTASFWPARRAASVDPLLAMRAD